MEVYCQHACNAINTATMQLEEDKANDGQQKMKTMGMYS